MAKLPQIVRGRMKHWISASRRGYPLSFAIKYRTSSGWSEIVYLWLDSNLTSIDMMTALSQSANYLEERQFEYANPSRLSLSIVRTVVSPRDERWRLFSFAYDRSESFKFYLTQSKTLHNSHRARPVRGLSVMTLVFNQDIRINQTAHKNDIEDIETRAP